MYLPRHFEIADTATLHDLIDQYNFATLVTIHEGRPFATHLPVVLQREEGACGRLISHVARANPQWRDFAADSSAEALVIFQGPHTYISPSWYLAHPSVPTWNYMVVHAYGVPRIIADHAGVRQALQALVVRQESAFAQPWTMDSLPDEYLDKMVRGVVAFEIPIARLEGKFKLNQNRSEEDRRTVVAALQSDGYEGAAVAEAMKALPAE